ncbi:hypothetical protein SAMN04487995_1988 [Dyadobacter koreensis]|uniref:Uncharacterized protein n=1 Tax=Dyadobacter koreensis TaxID=408657 RepID=A0A1H6T8J8_9BACT|nr:hypothetical protein [Dyadobacter koreensis]SEI74474.1 hypothetical protein SAMN04487995_1988 [Dyadobacter koreensis]
MSSYIFRKYPGYNPNEIQDWSQSTGIDPASFDPDNIAFGRGASKAGTSIPSPMARLELFDTAFQIVASDRGNLDGNTIYHQLVSDCLDVFQLLFNAKNSEIGPGKKIWFKEWKVQENIGRLKERGKDHPHNLLAKSLEQIFNDRDSSRFSETDSLFLIFYENKLLGGTSPLSLFFTTPNWARYIKNNDIKTVPQSADGKLFFSNDYRPLYKRDQEFIEYIYKLSLQFKHAFAKADGFRKYLNKTVDRYFPDFRHQFTDYQQAGTSLMDNEYSKIKTNVDGKFLTVNGLFFFHQKEEKEKEKIKSVSDFIIRATESKFKDQYNDKNEQQLVEPPLVLVDGMNIPGDYMEKNIPWNSSTRVKDFYHRGVPLFERKLPQGNALTTVTYPFLTIDDFLEDALVEMPFNINRGKFYTGFGGDFKYLLPIRKEYFNFFNLSDLKNNLSVEVNDGQVTANLKIPVKNRKGVSEIVFSRKYEKGKSIVEYRSDLGIFPFYQINDPDPRLKELNDYTILLAERNERMALKKLEFYSFKNFASDTTNLNATVDERSTWSDINAGNSGSTSRFYKIKEAFDYIQLAYTDPNGIDSSGLIIPNFETKTFNKDNLTKAFTFAIDFGTSNTHIAYMQNGEALPRPFDIGEPDQQMVLLNAPGRNESGGNKFDSYGNSGWMDLTLRREFLPPLLGPGQNISYPFKTATCEIVSFNNIQNKSLFSHINIGYYIDQEEVQASNVNYTTNLKWLLENDNNDSNKSRVSAFLKQLLLQIRAKIILNYGNPADLKVVWSVPLSMERGIKSELRKVLDGAFKDVFKNSGAKLLDPIPESVAPYFFLTKSDTDIQDTANVINVDIGGGTTDVMMFMESSGNRVDKYLTTSFRFAGSDIWGNGYRNKLKDNGFIRNYLSYQKKNYISPNEIKYFNKVKDDTNLSADDLVSLLFRYDDFKFSDSITIGNPDLLIIPYLHYSAIIFHLVQLIEIKDYPLPRYLSFTGKGSQYIKLLCGGDERDLEDFTRLLINAYTTKTLQSGFKIHLNTNPKEITANGSILYALASEDEKEKYRKNMDFIHPGFDPKTNSELELKLSTGTGKFNISDTFEIDSPLNVAVLNNLNEFLEKTLSNPEISRFLKDFKINGLKESLRLLQWNHNIFNGEGLIYDSYRKVLQDLHKQEGENEIAESLFFFALKDALYRLSKSITEIKPVV